MYSVFHIHIYSVFHNIFQKIHLIIKHHVFPENGSLSYRF